MSDLATIQRDVAPYDLAQLRVPTTYAYGGGTIADYYRPLGVKLAKVNPFISTLEIERAGHAAHLQIPDQLAALLRQKWELVCASA